MKYFLMIALLCAFGTPASALENTPLKGIWEPVWNASVIADIERVAHLSCDGDTACTYIHHADEQEVVFMPTAADPLGTRIATEGLTRFIVLHSRIIRIDTRVVVLKLEGNGPTEPQLLQIVASPIDGEIDSLKLERVVDGKAILSNCYSRVMASACGPPFPEGRIHNQTIAYRNLLQVLRMGLEDKSTVLTRIKE
jgi:hypothetical protein